MTMVDEENDDGEKTETEFWFFKMKRRMIVVVMTVCKFNTRIKNI